MKKTFLIVLLSLIIGNHVYSQELKIGFQTGIGTYSMSGLKEINKAVPQNLPFDTKLVSDFPANWYFRPAFSLQFDKISIGINYSFQSTGSRISAKDYSGEYHFDIQVNSNSPGIYSEVYLGPLKKAHLNLYSILGVSFSKLKLNEYLIALDQILTDETYSFKAQCFYIEPGFHLIYPVKFLNIGLYAGYIVQFGKQAFYTDDNKNNKLYSPGSSESIKPGWNGLRFGVSFYYILNLRNN